MLVIERTAARAALDPDACLAFDLADGTRIRVWLQAHKTRPGRVRCLIDAPQDVRVRRGRHLGPEGEGVDL